MKNKFGPISTFASKSGTFDAGLFLNDQFFESHDNFFNESDSAYFCAPIFQLTGSFEGPGFFFMKFNVDLRIDTGAVYSPQT